MPSPFEALLLGLAAWRVWHLIGKDDITEPLRRYITADGERETLEDFIECPFCLGFWVALAAVGAYAVWPEGAVWASLPFALNAAVVVVNYWLSRDE